MTREDMLARLIAHGYRLGVDVVQRLRELTGVPQTHVGVLLLQLRLGLPHPLIDVVLRGRGNGARLVLVQQVLGHGARRRTDRRRLLLSRLPRRLLLALLAVGRGESQSPQKVLWLS